MDKFKIEVGKRIYDLRRQKNIKQKNFCELIGDPTIQMLSNWEKGHSIPSAIYLINIAKALDTSIDYLLLGTKKAEEGIEKEIETYAELFTIISRLNELEFVSVNIDSYQFKKTSYINITCIELIKFLEEYKKLENARDVLGYAVFYEQLNKIIKKYNFKIEKNK